MDSPRSVVAQGEDPLDVRFDEFGRWSPSFAEELSDVTSSDEMWRALAGPHSELPVILGANREENFYELRPMLEHVFFWQLSAAEIDAIIQDRSVTSRAEVVIARMDGLSRAIVCVEPDLLIPIMNRVDKHLGLLPSTARLHRAQALVDRLKSPDGARHVIPVDARKANCQLQYEARVRQACAYPSPD
jgi:hypothetical protein